MGNTRTCEVCSKGTSPTPVELDELLFCSDGCMWRFIHKSIRATRLIAGPDKAAMIERLVDVTTGIVTGSMLRDGKDWKMAQLVEALKPWRMR